MSFAVPTEQSHRKSNLDFIPIVNELAHINSTTRAQEIDYKSLYDLLPDNRQAFYFYSGSLTTPPCYQVVNWIVMAERLNMNAKQIEMFRNLYAPPPRHGDDSTADEAGASHQDGHHENHAATGTHLIMPNVRALQSLNNRTIMASFTKHGGRLDTVTYNSAGALRLSIYPLILLIAQLLSCWLTEQFSSSKLHLRT